MRLSFNIINRLTIRHLRLNRGRTAITLLGIALSVAMVCCVAGFAMSVRDVFIREVIDKRGDYHVVFENVSPEVADALINEDVFLRESARIDGGDADGEPELFLRLKRPGRDIREVVGAIAERRGVSSWGVNSELLALEGVIPSDDVLFTFLVVAGIAISIIVVGSVIVIANAFNISAADRARQFGILKSVGATGGQLGRSVLFEALTLAAVAIPVGVLIGYLIQAAILRLTNSLLGEFASNFNADVTFRVIFDPRIVVFAALVAIFTATLSSWRPARRAASISPIDSIRQSRDISISSKFGGKALKTSPLIMKLFGFEGALAVKTQKRNRGSYRAAVVSLTLSIALFVSMSSFVWIINRGVDMEYGGYDFDVAVYTSGRLQPLDKVDAALRAIAGADMKVSRVFSLDTLIPEQFISPSAQLERTAEIGHGLAVHYMPDDEIEKYFDDKNAGNDGDGDLANDDTASDDTASADVMGVLLNKASYLQDGKRIESEPFNCEIGDRLPLLYRTQTGDGETPDEIGSVTIGTVTIGAVVTEILEDFPFALYNSSVINVYIPESKYRELFSEYEGNKVTYAATAGDPDAFAEAAEEALGSVAFDEGYGYGLNNISQITGLYRNITLIVMLFGYGFIAMLSLIAITSVVTTISTGMRLRRREFAMLYSVGMTPEGLTKMLTLESLLYGFKSILIGLPIGVALSYLIYWGMSGTFVFPYEPPLAAMLIGSAAVVTLTFLTMRYGKRKLGKISVAEAIRNENA